MPPARPMTRRKLPIGMQTFREVRQEGCYYVDKTAYIPRLLDEGKHFFLSRPRRFGKSLFLDTCKELFEGSEPLFEGLAVHDAWDWSVRRPVLRLSFGRGNFKEPGYLHTNLMAQLDGVERETGAASGYASAPERFGQLLEELHRGAGRRVAVLVDEYDKPILDALDVPDVARANRDFLRGLYATIKDCDAHVRFTFLTGVSRFSKVSLFSGLNNLTDLTIDPAYSAICGYTDADLDTVFAPELDGLDREAIRDWYKRLQLAGNREGLQPLRHPAAVPQPRVRRLLVRDRHADLSRRDPVPARHQSDRAGRHDRQRGTPRHVRRRPNRAGGPAVPDRLPHHSARRNHAADGPATASATPTARFGTA